MKILVIYFLVGVVLAYILNHQHAILKLIPVKADVKMRNKINKKQEQIKLYIKLCPLWPVLLIKEVYDAIQERRQS
tara:strand:+ start:728 stop:955 length:228 start_codon:yes stop_codon:yes gene_type:complete